MFVTGDFNVRCDMLHSSHIYEANLLYKSSVSECIALLHISEALEFSVWILML